MCAVAPAGQSLEIGKEVAARFLIEGYRAATLGREGASSYSLVSVLARSILSIQLPERVSIFHEYVLRLQQMPSTSEPITAPIPLWAAT
jgi:hypothetical protein